MPRHPVFSGYAPTPTQPNQNAHQQKLPPGYTRLSNVAASSWVWNLLWLASDNWPKASLNIVDLALYSSQYDDRSDDMRINKWLFTGKSETVMKKGAKKVTPSAFIGRMIGLANAGEVRLDSETHESNLSSKSICTIYKKTGSAIPATVDQLSALLNSQYGQGQHPLSRDVVAITANVRGAATRGRVRLQNAFRIVNGLGKPVTASYRLVALGVLAEKETGQNQTKQNSLGRLLSRDKSLNRRLDDLTMKVIKRVEHVKGVKVYAIMVDYLVEEPPSNARAGKGKGNKYNDDEDTGWVWQGQPRVWFERVVDVEFAPVENKSAFDEEIEAEKMQKKREKERREKPEVEEYSDRAAMERELTAMDEMMGITRKPKVKALTIGEQLARSSAKMKELEQENFSDDDDDEGGGKQTKLNPVRSNSAPSDEKRSLLERTGLKLKKKLCCGDFCGYDSGDEKAIMTELNSSGGHSKGAAAAVKLARKAALNARDGARRLKEEKQFQERQDLARKGLVQVGGGGGGGGDYDDEEDEELEREVHAQRIIQQKTLDATKPDKNLALYTLGNKSVTAAREDMRSDLTLEATWSPALRHWWRRVGNNGSQDLAKTKAMLITNPKRMCFFTAGDRIPIRWACHGDIQRVNVELHRDPTRGMGGKRVRSLVISSHRPMGVGVGVSRSSILWRVPKDYDRTGEDKRNRRNRTLAQRESPKKKRRRNMVGGEDTFWDDEDEEEERRKEEETFQNKFGRWRVVVSAASGVEKDLVFAVSDEFYLAPKSHDSKLAQRKNQQQSEVEGEEEEELQIHAWSQRLSRRAMNSNYVDNMMGRVMGVANEDDLVKPGAMGDFYRDIDVCSGCYKVYRQLDKRRHKMREAARKHKSIKGGGGLGLGDEDMDGGDGVGGSPAKLHGRGLKQEEVWEALGYGRVDRKATQEVVRGQKEVVSKLSQVPVHRDLRLIKAKEQKEKEVEERRRLRAAGGDVPVEVEEDEDGNRLTGVKKLIKRIEKRSHRLAEAEDDGEITKLLVGKDNGFVEKIDKNARMAKKRMKKMKKELVEEEEKLKNAQKEYSVFEGMNWDDAVSKFRGGRGKNIGAKGKNVAKMATKIVSVVGDAGTVNVAKGSPGGKTGGKLRLKPRGPNVGLKRGKQGHAVKKNHWDRLLHPWQRELENEKRDARKKEVEKNKRIIQLKNQVDNFFDVEMDKQLGRADEVMVAEAEEGREGMKESESEYWKEHWRHVYEEQVKKQDFELLRKNEELERKEHEIAVLASPKKGSVVSGMFGDLEVGGVEEIEDEYEALKRQQVVENMEMQVQGSQDFIDKFIVGARGSPASVAWEADGGGEGGGGGGSEGESEEEEEDSDEDGGLMWVPSPNREELLHGREEEEEEDSEEEEEGKEEGEEEEEEEDSDDDAGWEWKPKSAGAEKKPVPPKMSPADFMSWEPPKETKAPRQDDEEDDSEASSLASSEVEMASDEDDDEDGLLWQPTQSMSPSKSTPSSPKKQLQPPSQSEIRESLDQIQTEHQREKKRLETQLSLEQRRQKSVLLQKRAQQQVVKRGGGGEGEDWEGGGGEAGEAAIIEREKASAIADLQGLMSTLDKEKIRQKEDLKARVLARKNSLMAARSPKSGGGERGFEGGGDGEGGVDRRPEKISSHLKSKRDEMENEERMLREKIEAMMRKNM
ncbi:hypothetical protein TrLO_g1508 [Triparma laevis f. longispina]|uniref:Uncharacterized protein n=1 Tax=Triparma laevis f. longispina TaxID=1714387 RepID=A0A9W7A2E7_9STRA|nr:hypothetical protein TrLO_g1508 [Triparma laevis f. longispina]